MADAPPIHRTAAKAVALLGAALVLLGAFTYVPLLDVPWIRSTAAPNLAAMILGTALGILGAVRIRRRWPWILAVGESMVTLLFIGGIFFAWVPLSLVMLEGHQSKSLIRWCYPL